MDRVPKDIYNLINYIYFTNLIKDRTIYTR